MNVSGTYISYLWCKSFQRANLWQCFSFLTTTVVEAKQDGLHQFISKIVSFFLWDTNLRCPEFEKRKGRWWRMFYAWGLCLLLLAPGKRSLRMKSHRKCFCFSNSHVSLWISPFLFTPNVRLGDLHNKPCQIYTEACFIQHYDLEILLLFLTPNAELGKLFVIFFFWGGGGEKRKCVCIRVKKKREMLKSNLTVAGIAVVL